MNLSKPCVLVLTAIKEASAAGDRPAASPRVILREIIGTYPRLDVENARILADSLVYLSLARREWDGPAGCFRYHITDKGWDYLKSLAPAQGGAS